MTPRIGETAAEIAARYGAQAPHGLQVTVCPPATFSVDAFEPVPIKVQQQRFWDSAKSRAANRPDVQAAKARRERVLELADGTRTERDLAALIGSTVAAVRADIRALRAAGHEIRMSRGEALYLTHAGSVARLTADGKTVPQIAAALGVARRTVSKWRAWLRQEGRL